MFFSGPTNDHFSLCRYLNWSFRVLQAVILEITVTFAGLTNGLVFVFYKLLFIGIYYDIFYRRIFRQD